MLPTLTVAPATMVCPSDRKTRPVRLPKLDRLRTFATSGWPAASEPEPEAAWLVTGSLAWRVKLPANTFWKAKVPSLFTVRLMGGASPKMLLL